MKAYIDPMLTKIHDTIRSLRRAQSREAAAYRTYIEAQEAMDAALCDGLVSSDGRQRLVYDCMSETWRVEFNTLSDY